MNNNNKYINIRTYLKFCFNPFLSLKYTEYLNELPKNTMNLEKLSNTQILDLILYDYENSTIQQNEIILNLENKEDLWIFKNIYDIARKSFRQKTTQQHNNKIIEIENLISNLNKELNELKSTTISDANITNADNIFFNKINLTIEEK